MSRLFIEDIFTWDKELKENYRSFEPFNLEAQKDAFQKYADLCRSFPCDYETEGSTNTYKQYTIYVPYMTDFFIKVEIRDDKTRHEFNDIAQGSAYLWKDATGFTTNLTNNTNKPGNCNAKIKSVTYDTSKMAFAIEIEYDAWYGDNSGQWSCEIQVVDQGRWVFWPLTRD